LKHWKISSDDKHFDEVNGVNIERKEVERATMSKKKQKESVIVPSKVWTILQKIEALRVKERKLIRNLWYDLKENQNRRIHQMVFEQALQSNSAFPSVNKEELDNWVEENITTVFITLIEQGDILVEETKPNLPRKLINQGIGKIKIIFEKIRD